MSIGNGNGLSEEREALEAIYIYFVSMLRHCSWGKMGMLNRNFSPKPISVTPVPYMVV